MKTPLYILAIILLIISCTSQNSKNSNYNAALETLIIPKDSSTLYFNSKQNKNEKLEQNAINVFVNTWFSKMLFALKEPVLKDYKGQKEVYRFTWLRTFHHPVSIRLEKQFDVVKVTTKVCDGAGGYDPGRLIQDSTFTVSHETFENLISKIHKANFWNLPTEKKGDIGFDGSEWIIEAYKDNNYHLVVRWTPKRDNSKGFKAIGEYLISISHINKEELEELY